MPSSSMAAIAKRSGSPARTPAEFDIDAIAGEMLEDRGGHRRTHGVAAAGEEDRARQVGFSGPQGIIPSNAGRRSG